MTISRLSSLYKPDPPMTPAGRSVQIRGFQGRGRMPKSGPGDDEVVRSGQRGREGQPVSAWFSTARVHRMHAPVFGESPGDESSERVRGWGRADGAGRRWHGRASGQCECQRGSLLDSVGSPYRSRVRCPWCSARERRRASCGRGSPRSLSSWQSRSKCKVEMRREPCACCNPLVTQSKVQLDAIPAKTTPSRESPSPAREARLSSALLVSPHARATPLAHSLVSSTAASAAASESVPSKRSSRRERGVHLSARRACPSLPGSKCWIRGATEMLTTSAASEKVSESLGRGG